MGIRFSCPSGHKLHVKEFLAGKRGVCPHCGAKFVIPPAPNAPEAVVARAGTNGGDPPRPPATDFASQSIVISIVEPSRAPLARPVTTPPAIAEPIAAPPADVAPAIVTPPSDAAVSSAATIAKPVVPVDGQITPSVSKYAARRMRSRRHQTTLAVALLIAVIVLAALLVVVLRNQGAPPGEGDLARLEAFDTPSYAASAAPLVARQISSAKTI